MYYICVLPVAFPDFGFVQREIMVLAISFSLSPCESYRSTIFSFHNANDRKEKFPLYVHAPQSNRCLKEWTKRSYIPLIAPSIKEGIIFPSLREFGMPWILISGI